MGNIDCVCEESHLYVNLAGHTHVAPLGVRGWGRVGRTEGWGWGRTGWGWGGQEARVGQGGAGGRLPHGLGWANTCMCTVYVDLIPPAICSLPLLTCSII